MCLNETGTEKASLFIVDDCNAYRVLMGILLKREGYEVKAYENALDALKALESHIPDIIISDLEMPYMNGMAFFKELRKIDSCYKNIPFVFISSIEDELRIEEVKRISKRPFIRKSAPMGLVVETIKDFLENPELVIMGNSLKKTKHLY